jgi:hypothetical protein
MEELFYRHSPVTLEAELDRHITVILTVALYTVKQQKKLGAGTMACRPLVR